MIYYNKNWRFTVKDQKLGRLKISPELFQKQTVYICQLGVLG